MFTIKRKNETTPVTMRASDIKMGTLFDGVQPGNETLKGPFLRTYAGILIMPKPQDGWDNLQLQYVVFDNYVELDGVLEVWPKEK